MDIKDIRHIAHLARIGLSVNEIEKYRDLNDILALAEQLNEVNTDQIEPMAHPQDMVQRLRKDEVTKSNERNVLQKCSDSSIEAGIYLVPKVIDDGENP